MRNDKALVARINTYCKEIMQFVDGYDFESFLDDIKTSRACSASVEQIGECAKKISKDFKAAHAHIPWRNITGTRDIIAHNYDGINWETLWQIINKSIPELLEFTDEILKLGND